MATGDCILALHSLRRAWINVESIQLSLTSATNHQLDLRTEPKYLQASESAKSCSLAINDLIRVVNKHIIQLTSETQNKTRLSTGSDLPRSGATEAALNFITRD